MAPAIAAMPGGAAFLGANQMTRTPQQNMHGADAGASREKHLECFQRGVAQFNAREFFEAHETWEEIWLHSPEPEKTFLQGIIQISAAFHHYGRGNMAGTLSLLVAGLRRVSKFGEEHNGIALEPLRAEARQWAQAVKIGSDPGAEKLPRIHQAAVRALKLTAESEM
jgi:predicted metal-dependent hydrolase